jgi:hypothetical protein
MWIFSWAEAMVAKAGRIHATIFENLLGAEGGAKAGRRFAAGL